MARRRSGINPLIVVGLVAAGLAILYETTRGTTVTLNPGAQSVPTPSSGGLTLALPSGATGWASVTQTTAAGVQTLSPPAGTSSLSVPSPVAQGTVLTAYWHDASGNTQASVVTTT